MAPSVRDVPEDTFVKTSAFFWTQTSSFLHPYSLGLTTEPTDLLNWTLWQTVCGLSASVGSVANFLTQSSLMQAVRRPSALLYLLLCLPDHSISPHLSWLSLHHGHKWLQLPLNSLCFTISHRPFHSPLFGKASKLTLPRFVSLCSIQLSWLACLKSSPWRAVRSQVHRFG